MSLIPQLAKWRRREWVLAISALLVATLGPLGWIQWRQVQMLDDLSRIEGVLAARLLRGSR